MKAPMARPTVLHARYLLPVRPAHAVLEHHSVVIRDTRIVDVLSTTAAKSRYRDADQVNLQDHVLLPGLINMHTHSPMTLLRGYADDLPFQQWLNEFIWPLERKFVSEEFVADGTRLAMAEMIRAGTTCFNENYFFPDIMAAAVAKAGMRACIGMPIIELPTAWAGDVNEYLEKGLDVLKQWRGFSRLRFSLAPHAPYSVSDKSLEQIAVLSADLGLPVHMHLLETEWEVTHSFQQYGIHPLERLEAHRLLNSRLLAVHMTQLTADEIRMLADRRVHVVHCPQSNLKLASGTCRINDLRESGLNIAIGTDGAAANNNLDLLSEAQTAALLAKGVSGDPRAVDAFTALEMITINGAMALGLDHEIGTIETGKLADLAALDLRAPETQPVHNVVSQVIYAASSRQFTDVWVEGQRLMDAGKLTTLDLAGLMENAEIWRRKLSAAR